MASLHDEDERNILRDNERFDPVQEEFEAGRCILKGFGLRDDGVLLGIDGTEASIEGFVGDIDTDGLF
jgi:hypothetical protein